MITHINLNDFRNINRAEIAFSEGINLFIGNNGAGKTNILEAIGLFSIGKSCRNAKENELVNFDSELTEVKAVIQSEKKKLRSR